MNLAFYSKILPVIILISLLFIDDTSVFSYLYTSLLFVLVNKIVFKGSNENFFYFQYYVLIGIILYVSHLNLIPGYLGLTGPEGGIGTDDCRYYAQLVEGKVPYAIVFDFVNIMPFTSFLKTIYPFHIFSPLNVVLVNVLGVTFLPYISRLFMKEIGYSECDAQKTEAFVALCPYCTYYGCIIMRDMWIASCVVSMLLLFLKRKYIMMAVVMVFISFIRFGSLVFGLVGLLILVRSRIYNLFSNKTTGRIVFVSLIVLVFFLLDYMMPILIDISGGKLESGLMRTSFTSMLDANATLVALVHLPSPINVFALTIFFFFLPFLNFQLYTLGVFNMASLFNNVFTPLFFFFIWIYIFVHINRCIFHSDSKSRSLLLIVIFYSLALGTISLQPRHKTVLMPFLCMVASAGYGIVKSEKNSFAVSYIAAIILVIAEVAIAFLRT